MAKAITPNTITELGHINLFVIVLTKNAITVSSTFVDIAIIIVQCVAEILTKVNVNIIILTF